MPLLVLTCLCAPGEASAQTDAEVNSGIQFNFTTPGARSLALGGAFVGLADDATAAFTNPAGLVNLTRPQVSAEARRLTYRNSFPDRGHAFGFVTGMGVDTIEGLRSAETESAVTSLSFLSYVHPKRGSKKQPGGIGEGGTTVPKARQTPWTVAFYRHQLVDFEAAFTARGAFFDFLDGSERRTIRLTPLVAGIALDITSAGVSGAYRVGDKLALGLGVSFYDFRIDSLQQSFSQLGIDPVTRLPLPADAPGTLFGAPDFSRGLEVVFQRQRGEDEDVAVNAGFLAELSKVFSVGGVYRQGPEFELTATNHVGAFAEALTGIARGTVVVEQGARFRVPDVLGIGVAFKLASERGGGRGLVRQREVKLSFDYNRVRYSALTESMVSIVRAELSPTQQAALDGLRIDDGDEFRLGCEATFIRDEYNLYLRLGGWWDPDHKIRFAGEPGLDPETRSIGIQFPGGEGVVHTSAGIGLALFGEKLKLDAGVDFADTVDTTSLSLVYQFGGR